MLVLPHLVEGHEELTPEVPVLPVEVGVLDDALGLGVVVLVDHEGLEGHRHAVRGRGHGGGRLEVAEVDLGGGR